MNSDTGKWLIAAGAIILLAGVLLYFFHDKLHWLGRLPGDISLERGSTRFYFPLVTMLIVSLLLTILINLFKKLFH